MTRQMPQLPPYARALDIHPLENADSISGAPILAMPFSLKVQGRPGFLHGGAISGLLEMSAIAAIHAALMDAGNDAPIKQVNVTIDFMRGGLAEMTLISLAMHIDTAFVSTHHIVRILFIVMAISLVSRILFGPPKGDPL